MEHMLLDKKLPNALIREIRGYLYYDKLDMQWFRYLHSEDYGAVVFQISLYGLYYGIERIEYPGLPMAPTREIMSFAQYCFSEVKDLNWW